MAGFVFHVARLKLSTKSLSVFDLKTLVNGPATKVYDS
jgi:hypothetical protein